MKKLLYGALIVLVVILCYLTITSFPARSGPYQLHECLSNAASDEAGVILLDTQSGKTWALKNGIWQPIDKVGEQRVLEGPDPRAERAMLFEAMENLRRQQEMELKALKTKYAEEYSLLLERLEEALAPAEKQAVTRATTAVRKPAALRTTARKTPPKRKIVDPSPYDYAPADDENAPPAWIED